MVPTLLPVRPGLHSMDAGLLWVCHCHCHCPPTVTHERTTSFGCIAKCAKACRPRQKSNRQLLCLSALNSSANAFTETSWSEATCERLFWRKLRQLVRKRLRRSLMHMVWSHRMTLKDEMPSCKRLLVNSASPPPPYIQRPLKRRTVHLKLCDRSIACTHILLVILLLLFLLSLLLLLISLFPRIPARHYSHYCFSSSSSSSHCCLSPRTAAPSRPPPYCCSSSSSSSPHCCCSSSSVSSHCCLSHFHRCDPSSSSSPVLLLVLLLLSPLLLLVVLFLALLLLVIPHTAATSHPVTPDGKATHKTPLWRRHMYVPWTPQGTSRYRTSDLPSGSATAFKETLVMASSSPASRDEHAHVLGKCCTRLVELHNSAASVMLAVTVDFVRGSFMQSQTEWEFVPPRRSFLEQFQTVVGTHLLDRIRTATRSSDLSLWHSSLSDIWEVHLPATWRPTLCLPSESSLPRRARTSCSRTVFSSMVLVKKVNFLMASPVQCSTLVVGKCNNSWRYWPNHPLADTLHHSNNSGTGTLVMKFASNHKHNHACETLLDSAGAKAWMTTKTRNKRQTVGTWPWWLSLNKHLAQICRGSALFRNSTKPVLFKEPPNQRQNWRTSPSLNRKTRQTEIRIFIWPLDLPQSEASKTICRFRKLISVQHVELRAHPIRHHSEVRDIAIKDTS